MHTIGPLCSSDLHAYIRSRKIGIRIGFPYFRDDPASGGVRLVSNRIVGLVGEMNGLLRQETISRSVERGRITFSVGRGRLQCQNLPFVLLSRNIHH